MLAVEFARFLGLEFSGRANITDIVNAVCATAAYTRVELVCVDELHNLNLATRAGAEVSDQLKYFAERLPATFIYAGIDVEAQGLFAGVRGRQIAGRFTVIPAAPFAYGTGAQREQWRALIAALESLLRLHRHRTGSLVKLDEYLYRRSGGMIGSLSQLVRGAAILAIEDRSEQMSKKLLDSVPVDYAAERADTASRPRGRGSRPPASRPRADEAVPAADRRRAGTPGNRRLLPGSVGEPSRPTAAGTVGTDQRFAPRLRAARRCRRPVGGRDRPRTRAPRPCVARAASRARLVGVASSAPARLLTLRRTTARRSVTRLLPHHRYVCTRHRYWIGPPDVDQPATALDGIDDIVRAQRHHLRLLRRHGPGATYDAVLTGFLFADTSAGIGGKATSVFNGNGPAASTSSSRRAPRRRRSAPPGCSRRSIPKPSASPASSPAQHGDTGRRVMPISSDSSQQRSGVACTARTTTRRWATTPSPTG